MTTLNWEDRKWSSVECRITMREPHRGEPIKESCLPLQGQVGKFSALWLMNANDPYPGEWALAAEGGLLETAGIAWIASGDATPIAGE